MLNIKLHNGKIVQTMTGKMKVEDLVTILLALSTGELYEQLILKLEESVEEDTFNQIKHDIIKRNKIGEQVLLHQAATPLSKKSSE